jgi:hypothetical protein
MQKGEGRLPIINKGQVFYREPANHVPELYTRVQYKFEHLYIYSFQWAVVWVAITMMTMCMTLVGTMLSVTSEYQVLKGQCH